MQHLDLQVIDKALQWAQVSGQGAASVVSLERG